MTKTEESEKTEPRSGRAVVVAGAAGALLIAGYFATGMPGMDHETPGEASMASMASMDPDSMPFVRLDPEGFAARLSRPSAFVVNVHTPYAGELDGTDAFIAFDEIIGDDRLPTDKDAEILLYCQSGRMSDIAANALVDAGYTDVADLRGGMEAWEAAGMPVRREPIPDN